MMAIKTNGSTAATANKPSKIGGVATWVDERAGATGTA